MGPPAEGEVVQVKWPDGKLYGAKYLGSNVAHMYQVSALSDACRVGQEEPRETDTECAVDQLPER